MTSVDTTAPLGVAAAKSPGPSRRRAWAGRLFVAPNLAAVAVFMLFPLGFSLYMSFQRWDVFRPPKFVGLKNFEDLFTSDPLFVIAIRNGAARVDSGQVTAAFLSDVNDECRRSELPYGTIRGFQNRDRIALEFSRHIPDSCRQRLRNAWLLTG